MNSTSNIATPMAKKGKKKQKKTKAPAVAYLKITWNNGNSNAFKISNFTNSLMNVERYLRSVEGKWKWASLKEIGTGTIYHYYHKKTGSKRLDIREYRKQFDAYSLYIIHTPSYRKRTGTQKGTSKRIYNLEEIHNYWNYRDVLRIDVYQEGKLINRYEKGKFLM